MKVVVQRAGTSSVKVNEKIVGNINSGLVLLVGFTDTDTIDTLKFMAKKIVNLRIFPDEEGIMNKSILDYGGDILSISQFTLYADASKGNRPSFTNCMHFEKANELYKLFNNYLRELNLEVKEGMFGEDMKVSLINDGPFTLVLDSEELFK